MIVVCLAPADLRPEVDDLTGSVRSDVRRAVLPAAEATALEYGLRLAESWDGWVLVVSHGTAAADGVLRESRALGAEAVRVDAAHPAEPSLVGPHPAEPSLVGPHPAGPDDLAGHGAAVAADLARAIESRGHPAVVLCGDRSGGTGVGAVPGFLAAELGLDQALGLVSVSVGGPGQLTVERRLDGGWREQIRVDGPAVLSVEGAGVRLRRAGLDAALAASEASIEVVPATGSRAGGLMRTSPSRPYRPRTRPVPAPEGDAHARLLALTGALSSREPARVVGPLPAAQAADELLAYLKRRGYTA
jgi:electron transfer flavoprotein beta subunit